MNEPWLPVGRPALWLAPMQDVTNLAFLRVLARRGGPDLAVTEYFRVHAHSRLDREILRCIDENPTGRPVAAQVIGSDPAALARAARELARHPVAAIDLNLGCPAPVVCRKEAGGGMLRDPAAVDRALGALREAIPGRFTVKTRLGHADPAEFPALVECFARHRLDALTIHARTVRDGYATPVRPAWVRLAAERLACPVLANGNAVDVATGLALLAQSGAAGLMIGRGAIRNPWLFGQLRAHFDGRPPPQPTRRDLLGFLLELHEESARETVRYDPHKHVHQLKKTLLYSTQGLEPEFEHGLRRVAGPDELRALCRRFLDRPEPLPARPDRESKLFRGFPALLEPAGPEAVTPAGPR
jgi:tRNA-dihydrouridine synthase C